MNPEPQCCSGPYFRPVTHVIFDLDGTILDTEGIYNDAIASIGKEYGKEYTNRIKQMVAGSVELDTAKTATMEMDLPITTDEFLAKFREISNVMLADAAFMPGAEALITHLHGHHVPIAIATSSPMDAMLLKASKKREIFDLFRHIVCGSTDPEVENGKPHPDIFLVCASRFPDKPAPENCLVFEDSVNGVLGALRAGMQVVMVPESIVPYEKWNMATMRLDSLAFFVPELFGLPPYGAEVEVEVQKESVPVEEKTTDEAKIKFRVQKGPLDSMVTLE